MRLGGNVSTPTINFNRKSLASLKEAYARCVEAKCETFEWEGNTFLASYAKYLIEYLEGALPK